MPDNLIIHPSTDNPPPVYIGKSKPRRNTPISTISIGKHIDDALNMWQPNRFYAMTISHVSCILRASTGTTHFRNNFTFLLP
ncbi:hypothetical protein Scep_028246 [Stephania cephalantha]|uniref:Uncharacterized protein n=1 Tax=Stephania cephalantha TaxID=152367 RepID=A0AAP0E9K2_9MAGN